MLERVSAGKTKSWFILVLTVGLFFTGVYFYPILLPFCLSIIVALGVIEFCNLWSNKGYQIPSFITVLFSILIIWDVYLARGVYFEKILIWYLVLTTFQKIYKKEPPDFVSVSLGIFALIYIAKFMSYAISIWQLEYDMKYLLFVVILVGTSDTFCYLGGVMFGKVKIFGALSPKKTLEGWITGILFTVLVSAFLSYIPYFDISVKNSIILAVVVGIFGQIGDVFESAIKRAVGVKDSGSLIPEHGGILDRIDSFLFVCILSYYFLFYAVYR